MCVCVCVSFEGFYTYIQTDVHQASLSTWKLRIPLLIGSLHMSAVHVSYGLVTGSLYISTILIKENVHQPTSAGAEVLHLIRMSMLFYKYIDLFFCC